MDERSARAISTVGIWAAVAVTLAFGVFRTNWNGDVAMLLMFLCVVVICGAAAISTAAVWGWRPNKQSAIVRGSQASSVSHVDSD
jgi:hypothetical protein